MDKMKERKKKKIREREREESLLDKNRGNIKKEKQKIRKRKKEEKYVQVTDSSSANNTKPSIGETRKGM